MITKSKVTIRDVAKEAGVSPATVSGVLNNGGKQNHETINRVWADPLKHGHILC